MAQEKGSGQLIFIILLAAILFGAYLFLNGKLNLPSIMGQQDQVKGLTCQKRPHCPPTNPACQVKEPSEGWCPISTN